MSKMSLKKKSQKPNKKLQKKSKEIEKNPTKKNLIAATSYMKPSPVPNL